MPTSQPNNQEQTQTQVMEQTEVVQKTTVVEQTQTQQTQTQPPYQTQTSTDQQQKGSKPYSSVDVTVTGQDVGAFLAILFADNTFKYIQNQAVLTYTPDNYAEARELIKANNDKQFQITANGRPIKELRDVMIELVRNILKENTSAQDRGGFDLNRIDVERMSVAELDSFLHNPDRGIEDAVNAINSVDNFDNKFSNEQQERLH
ncbi:hypothetical protein [Brevibacillus dissolubilis]|uniref:hypothetical protein n=1 Tax=Brevibacillus dissolubilis TaxID=1844116 RepID=UPI0011167A19|nr:hypothetical protein [Brevibacillus dissolubilis]